MKIVIDIPEGRYNWIISHASKHPIDYADAGDLFFRKAVESGTVLPKGHGDLIDRDELLPKIHGVKSIVAVLDAPTIISADKEAKNEDSN